MGAFVLPVDSVRTQFEREYRDIRQTVRIPNIVLLGTSTLCNVVFGHTVAQAASGLPTTCGFIEYLQSDSTVNIIDSEGYELLDQTMKRNYSKICRSLLVFRTKELSKNP